MHEKGNEVSGSKSMATVNDILRATLVYNIAAASVGNLVHHYRVTVGTETNYVTIATAIEAALDTAYNPAEAFMHNDIAPVSLELAEWDFTDNEWDGKASVTALVPNGGATGDALPAGVSALMRFPTAELRRQARKFVPGMAEINVVGDGHTAGAIVGYLAASALINNDIVAGAVTLRPCTFNDTPLSARFETSSDFSTTSIVNTNVAYQRRRQPGAGI